MSIKPEHVSAGYHTHFVGGKVERGYAEAFSPFVTVQDEPLGVAYATKFTVAEELARSAGGLSQPKSDEELEAMTREERMAYQTARDNAREDAEDKARQRAIDTAESVRQAILGKGRVPTGVTFQLTHPVALATQALLNSHTNTKQV